jgi:cytochrome c oxidase assembly protein subunit 15
LTGYANLHRFILLTTGATFLLLVAGGLVTSTQSGLSVPDWPTTYGHFMFSYPFDQMVGGIFYEHSHRMIASVVGFLTVIVALWLWKREDRRWVRNLGLAALGLVVVQGLLGGLTVLFLLPAWISVSHATMAQTFFCVMVSLSLITAKWWRLETTTPAPSADRTAVRWAVVTAIAIYLQLILGAIMRHTDAGLAVPDLPLAYGQLFPSLGADALARYNQQLIDLNLRLAADGAITAQQIVAHMAHRLWALVVAGGTIATAAALLRRRHLSGRFGILAVMLLAILAAQITLGVLTVLSAKAVDITTAHVATGAALLAAALLSALHAARVFGIRRTVTKTTVLGMREATA